MLDELSAPAGRELQDRDRNLTPGSPSWRSNENEIGHLLIPLAMRFRHPWLMARLSLRAGLCARSGTAAGVRAVGKAGLEFAEVDVAAEEAFACVEQAGEDAGADQAEYGFAEAEADPRGGEEEAEQGGELSGGHVS